MGAGATRGWWRELPSCCAFPDCPPPFRSVLPPGKRTSRLGCIWGACLLRCTASAFWWHSQRLHDGNTKGVQEYAHYLQACTSAYYAGLEYTITRKWPIIPHAGHHTPLHTWCLTPRRSGWVLISHGAAVLVHCQSVERTVLPKRCLPRCIPSCTVPIPPCIMPAHDVLICCTMCLTGHNCQLGRYDVIAINICYALYTGIAGCVTSMLQPVCR